MKDISLYTAEIQKWRYSKERKAQLTAERYYRGEHDILKRKRTVIGVDGKLQEVENLPNAHIVDNQYAKMVDQKTNYLLGKPFNIQTDNKPYETALSKVFNKKFKRLLSNIGEDSLNAGIAWLYVYYDENGEFKF
jgi:predicted metal-dependent hydrolase